MSTTSRPLRGLNDAADAPEGAPRVTACPTLAPSRHVPMLLLALPWDSTAERSGGSLKPKISGTRRRTAAGALLVALASGLALACASAAAPQASPAALASASAAPVDDKAAPPSTAATATPADAAASIPAADAPASAPDASAATPDASAATTEPAPASSSDAESAQAAADLDYQPEVHEPDPFEPVNRGFFVLNRGLDHVLIGPLARGYAWIVPAPGRRAVRRVFENLDAPVTVTNSLLQLELRHAGVATLRFAVNSTVGMLGLFDPARAMGLKPVEADFGQTLGRLGVGTGPYIVLPVLGPTTARDGIGTLVDSLLRPQTWLLTPAEGLVFASGDGITMRDEEGPALDALEGSSVDFYAALRAAYFMHREAMVDGETDSSSLAGAIPETEPAEPAPAEPGPAALPAAEPLAPRGGTSTATLERTTSAVAPDVHGARAVPAAPAP